MCNPTPVLRHAAKAAAAAADAQAPAGTKGGAAELEEKDAKSEDRPRFDGPEPIHPCTKRHHVHHFLVWSAVAALLVYDGFFWSLPLTAFMVWYGDAYTAVLHCALDRPACLDIKILTAGGLPFCPSLAHWNKNLNVFPFIQPVDLRHATRVCQPYLNTMHLSSERAGDR